MNWEAIGAVGEVAGAIAVVATLAYLAKQIRQNSAHVRAQIDLLEASTTTSTIDLAIRDEAMVDLIARVLEGADLDPREQLRFSTFMLMNLTNFENFYRQYKNGLMDEEQWDKWFRTLEWWFSHASIQDWWHSNPLPVNRSLTGLIEQKLLVDNRVR